VRVKRACELRVDTSWSHFPTCKSSLNHGTGVSGSVTPQQVGVIWRGSTIDTSAKVGFYTSERGSSFNKFKHGDEERKSRKTEESERRRASRKTRMNGDMASALRALQQQQVNPYQHSEERPFKCDQCEKAFKEKKVLRKHMLTHQPRRFHCDFPGCGKSFYERAKLKRHNLVHTGEKNFVCTFEGCGKRFALKANLQTHFRVHTGQRPYKCLFPGCEKRFSQTSGRNSHYKTHLRKKRKLEDMGLYSQQSSPEMDQHFSLVVPTPASAATPTKIPRLDSKGCNLATLAGAAALSSGGERKIASFKDLVKVDVERPLQTNDGRGQAPRPQQGVDMSAPVFPFQNSSDSPFSPKDFDGNAIYPMKAFSPTKVGAPDGDKTAQLSQEALYKLILDQQKQIEEQRVMMKSLFQTHGSPTGASASGLPTPSSTLPAFFNSNEAVTTEASTTN